MARFLKIAALGCEMPVPAEHAAITQAEDYSLEYLRRQLDSVLCDAPELIVLPEACDIPASFSPEKQLGYVCARKGRVMELIRETAKRHRVCIAYPTYRACPDGTFRNSVYFAGGDGSILGVYDKNHLTAGEMGELKMLCGAGPLVLHTPAGRVGFLTCFDLNFSSLMESYARLRPELLLFPSAFHGGPLQTLWAVSCRAYLVSAVRNLPCSVLAPTGELLAASTGYFHRLSYRVNLDCALVHLDFNMEKLEAARKKYGQKIRIRDPGLLGSVMLTSESDEHTAAYILREFGMESLDEYLSRMEKMQRQHTAEKTISPVARPESRGGPEKEREDHHE